MAIKHTSNDSLGCKESNDVSHIGLRSSFRCVIPNLVIKETKIVNFRARKYMAVNPFPVALQVHAQCHSGGFLL